MSVRSSRRQFLTTAAGTTSLGLGDLSVLAGLRPVNVADARLDPNVIRTSPPNRTPTIGQREWKV